MEQSTRDDILRNYRVEDGIIRDFGQFEGEPIWVAAYWQAAMDGFTDAEADDLNGYANSFYDVTPEDRAAFPEIPAEAIAVCIWQNDQGFILHSVHAKMTAHEWADIVGHEANDHLGPVCEHCSERTDHADFCPHCDTYQRDVAHLEELVADGECIKIDAGDEHPIGYVGLVMEVTDHGNVTLYRIEQTPYKSTEIWSCV